MELYQNLINKRHNQIGVAKYILGVLIFVFSSIIISCSNSNPKKSNVIEDSNVIASKSNFETNFFDDVFDIKELTVIPSPNTISALKFVEDENLIDYEISPKGETVAILIHNKKSNNASIKFWNLNTKKVFDNFVLPKNIIVKSISYHPTANSIYILAKKQNLFTIYRVSKSGESWEIDSVFSSNKELTKPIFAPRPFIIAYDRASEKEIYNYRLFLGMGDNGNFRIISITEKGERLYQVVGPSKTLSKREDFDAEYNPSEIISNWAVPVAFHPAGHKLIWKDKNNNFNIISYDSECWGQSKPMGISISNGNIIPTSNGIGLIYWHKDISGVEVDVLNSKKKEQQLSNFQFTLSPVITPDGRGLIGKTVKNRITSLTYTPINVPLADVVNAWMYANTKKDIELFSKNYGLFRGNVTDQIYKLYETENYYCDQYDRNVPTRPYLVTTDIFWELFGSAYQGLFIIKERDEAIPNFWKMIDDANKYLITENSTSKWSNIFKTLNDIKNNSNTPEIQRINEEKDCFSELLNDDFRYSELKPIGHYNANEEIKKYFKAFRYFINVYKGDSLVLRELNDFPDEVLKSAKQWISAYNGFIAPTNTPLVIKGIENKPPKYCNLVNDNKVIFPLSWGFDNEVFNSTIENSRQPVELQVKGRLLPSGLDLATVLGNDFAENLLKVDYEEFPQLRKVINNLKESYNVNKNSSDFKGNIYNQWINAMATQWIDTVNSTNVMKDNGIWQTKRLQTGLATWATLRHATILVNATCAAECGEGGFEEILMTAPRGYVEPDPYTFEAIARLFDYMIDFTTNILESIPSDKKVKTTLYEGIIKRLEEASSEARYFKNIAEKEREGEELNDEENKKVLYVARVAEHLFLVFNSISNDSYGLADPEPIAKIANVAGDGLISPYLMSAVGNTMEWDFIVPHYGRKHIVKGAIYSYYEFKSNKILNDKEWQKRVINQEYLSWIKPFVSKQELSGVAKSLY